MGTGGDNAAIQVFDAVKCEQIAEWKHNKTPIPAQIKLLADIVNYIHSETGKADEIYYSVENNSIGEAALIAINHFGEENIKGIFLSEPKKPGASNIYRKGFNTTNKGKIAACAKLKHWIERIARDLNEEDVQEHVVASGTSISGSTPVPLML